MTHINKIEFSEKNGVDYGYVPGSKKRIGFMRFKPGAAKPKVKSSSDVVSYFDCRFVLANRK